MLCTLHGQPLIPWTIVGFKGTDRCKGSGYQRQEEEKQCGDLVLMGLIVDGSELFQSLPNPTNKIASYERCTLLCQLPGTAKKDIGGWEGLK